MHLFHPAVATWFNRNFAAPTPAQAQAWKAIHSGCHTLIAAPTGSGKTLAAFLAAIDALLRRGLAGNLKNETQVVYVSPLKALSKDIERNLQAPLAGIREVLAEQGLPDVEIRSWVRTGDTPPGERQRMHRCPPHIAVTTPESLYILLGSDSGRAMLATTRTVIIDEIHAVAPNKRGAHLAISLERLVALCGDRLLRVGLSATQKPIETVARFLVGAKPARPAAARAPWLEADSGCQFASTGSHFVTQNSGPGLGTPSPESLNGALKPEILEHDGFDPKSSCSSCRIIDTGHIRARDLALEVPDAPLEAVMSAEVWAQVYDRLAQLIA
ncbi:MAG: DEAD/DEAH box helicase, partial [Acetobacteraceae bacterium]|nr:DEAD/DEAH box helicase [Acetobacteraceae bacterium]